MEIRVKEEVLNYYSFWLDGVKVLDNVRNDMTADYSDTDFPDGFAHFKTSEGASIFKNQRVQPTDVTVVSISDDEVTPATMDELKAALDDINFYDWMSNFGGGGGGGVDRFDELEDTGTYVGGAGKVWVINPAETALIKSIFYNFFKITQHADYSPQNVDLAMTDIGKKLTVQNVAGQPKLKLADDTVNAPIPPNEILSFTPTVDGEEVTVAAGGAVRINGTIYSNAIDLVIPVPYAAAGNHRYDIIYGRANDISGEVWEIATGVEALETEDIAEPSLPANTVRATKLLVTDGGIEENPYPFGVPWITKESKGTNQVFDTGVINNLQRSNLTHYDFSETAEVRGLETASSAPDYDPNYVNQKYTFKNSSAGDVTFKHLHASGEIKFRFPNAADFVLGAQYTAEFFYNKVTNTLDYIGNFGGGTGGFSKTLQWDGTSTITVPSGFTGTVFNENQTNTASYTLAGTDLTITGGAFSGDFLQITQE